MEHKKAKPVRWVGSSRTDLQAFPVEPRTNAGYAIWVAQLGDKAPQAKPLKGIITGAGVLEVVESHDGNAYRVVYTVRFADAVYVLHAFQKKSVKGKRTQTHDVTLVKKRYKAAEADYRERGG